MLGQAVPGVVAQDVRETELGVAVEALLTLPISRRQILATKWLESGKFAWPPVTDGAICLSSTQLALLLDGLAWSQAAAPVVKKPVMVG